MAARTAMAASHFFAITYLVIHFADLLAPHAESWYFLKFLHALLILPPLLVIGLTMLLRNALAALDPKAERASMTALHAVAAGFLGITLLTGGEQLMRAGKLMPAFSWLLWSPSLLLLPIVCWGKRLIDRRRSAACDGGD